MNQYDIQIAELTKHPNRIHDHWMSAEGLFKFVGQDTENVSSGCLTMIRSQSGRHFPTKAIIKGRADEELTQAIINDSRIPKSDLEIEVEHLPVFKEWQERIDKLQNS